MSIPDILATTFHRTRKLPSGPWKYYQEWNDALFLHWEIPVDILRKSVPENLKLDLFEGKAYVSLVAFTMQKIRPKNLPAVAYISDFHEINLRTYIKNDNKKGVYFLNIEAEKTLSAFIARKMSGLPYGKSAINRANESYVSVNAEKGFSLDAQFEVREIVADKSDLDKWLTERYCLYLDQDKKMYRYEVHHKEWELKNVKINRLNLKYNIGEFSLPQETPELVHYSEGVKVVAWGKEEA